MGSHQRSATSAQDFEAKVGELKTRVSVVLGARDICIDPAMGAELAGRINARLSILPGVGRHPHLQRPGLSARADVAARLIARLGSIGTFGTALVTSDPIKSAWPGLPHRAFVTIAAFTTKYAVTCFKRLVGGARINALQ